MRMYDIIKTKRDGGELSAEQIKYFISGYTNGEIPDYQAAALCMAIYFNGMSAEEIAELTFAVRDSGIKCDFSSLTGIRADKHSTGGVGDKTSLVAMPIVAACGVKVAKMSGRGLGHTGGTVDKLESIPGLRTDLPEEEFLDIVRRVGICIVGQTRDLAPADKKLYALRDVTATVDSLPLIVSSIMGKKLAADDDCILLDVKTGSGAFCKTLEESRRLAEVMVDIGKRAGKKTAALITDMDVPLGNAIGNALEVKEAVGTLRGEGPADLTELCVTLAANVLFLAEKAGYEGCEAMARAAIADGTAFAVFCDMAEAQHGDRRALCDLSLLPRAETVCEVRAKRSGFIVRTDTEAYGGAALLLGAGRNTKEDGIDYGAGIVLCKKTGDRVEEGETVALLHTNRAESVPKAEEILLRATEIGDAPPAKRPLVLGKVT